MQIKKFIPLLAAGALLISCGAGNNSISREEAAKKLEKIEETTSAEGFSYPTKFTLSTDVETTSNGSTKKVETSVAYDKEGQYYHTIANGGAEGVALSTEQWMYVTDGTLYQVIKGAGQKMYTTVTSGFDKLFESVFPSDAFDGLTSTIPSLLVEIKSDNFDSTYSESSFSSSGDGNFSMTVKGTVDGAENSASLTIDNYLITSFTSKSEKSSVSITADWNKVDRQIPDLTGFTKI